MKVWKVNVARPLFFYKKNEFSDHENNIKRCNSYLEWRQFLKCYYFYFSNTSWNCLFHPVTFFRIHSKVSHIWSFYCIFLVKRNKVFGFSAKIFVLLVLKLMNLAYIVWYTTKKYTAYLSIYAEIWYLD